MGSHSAKHAPKHLRPARTTAVVVWGAAASLAVALITVVLATTMGGSPTPTTTVNSASETVAPTTKRTVTLQVDPNTEPVIPDPYAKDSGLISQRPSTTSPVPTPSAAPVSAPGGLTARISATSIEAPAPTTTTAPTATVAPAPTTTEAPAPTTTVAPAPVPLNPRCDPVKLNNPEPQTVAVCNKVLQAIPEIPYVGGRAARPANPTSCHPKGLGLDLMVYEDKALGDRVAAYVQDNKAELGLTTILWQVADHYDHVHISVLPCEF